VTIKAAGEEARAMQADRRGTLVLLACHGVYDPDADTMYTDRPEFVNDRPAYEAQIDYAFRHLRYCTNWRPGSDPLLVISGSFSKQQRHCSESRSYLELARHMGLAVPDNVVLEEYALTSIENMLLSLYAYHDTRGAYPEAIDVISWAFKQRRFEVTLRAISEWTPLGEEWNGLDYFPVGDLRRKERQAIERTIEQRYIDALERGLEAYYEVPETQTAIARRDPHNTRPRARKRYAGYPLPF